LVFFLSHAAKNALTLALSIFIYCFASSFAGSQERQPNHDTELAATNLGASGLPLPRFVSLRSWRVNMRIGPKNSYPIAWTYTQQGLPVEIIEEYDNWRRIRDSDGDEGWVEQALLSGKRTAMPAPWIKANSFILRANPDEGGKVVAEIEANVIGDLRKCRQGWCELNIRADCNLIEPAGAASSLPIPQFLTELFSFGACSKNYRGWLKQSEIWGIYPGEEF